MLVDITGNREKQIEEMAKLICTYPQCVNYNKIGGCKIAECQTVDIAENLFEQGYRKTADIAEEIFAEIEYLIWQYDTRPASELRESIAELKKKYTESEDNDD